MSSHFDRAMAEITKKALKNGGVTNEHIVEAMQATNEDLEEVAVTLANKVEVTHEETRIWHGSVREMVAAHIVEASERDRRITNLELAEEDRRRNCIPAMEGIAKELHAQAHAEYVASTGQSDFQSKLMWFLASNLGKFALVVLGIIAGVLINFAFYGHP